MTTVPPGSRTRRTQKGGPSRIKHWIGVFVVAVVLFFILLNRHGLLRLYRLRAEQERLEAEIAMLQVQAVRLRQETASLQIDLAYIERLAREKYRMVKRGEKVFRVMQNNRQSDRDEGEKIPR